MFQQEQQKITFQRLKLGKQIYCFCHFKNSFSKCWAYLLSLCFGLWIWWPNVYGSQSRMELQAEAVTESEQHVLGITCKYWQIPKADNEPLFYRCQGISFVLWLWKPLYTIYCEKSFPSVSLKSWGSLHVMQPLFSCLCCLHIAYTTTLFV